MITANLNTGKSCFLYYVLFRLLSERKPVAFQLLNQFVVFQEDGISSHPLDAEAHILPKGLGSWALSDSNEGTMQPCGAFRNASKQNIAWIVQATSPLKERWKMWQKYLSATIFVMEPFVADEMTALGSV
jgi:hypothetical protein